MITEAARRIYVRFPHDPVTDFLSWCGPIVAFPTELMTRIDISYVVIVRKAATDSGYIVELRVKNPSEENSGYPFRFNNLEDLWNMLIFVTYRDFMTRSSDQFLILDDGARLCVKPRRRELYPAQHSRDRWLLQHGYRLRSRSYSFVDDRPD